MASKNKERVYFCLFLLRDVCRQTCYFLAVSKLKINEQFIFLF